MTDINTAENEITVGPGEDGTTPVATGLQSSFTVQRLTGSRALVRGQDATGHQGEVVLYTGEWDELLAAHAHDQAVDSYDDAVREFFAPLMEAAAAHEQSHFVKVDPLTVIVEQEEVEHTEGQPAVVRNLLPDTVIMRVLEGFPEHSDRLIWVGGTQLELLAE